MVKKKGGNTNQLGRSLMKDRFKTDRAKRDKEGWLHTSDLQDGYDWGKLQSVTETGDLEEFLATAELTGREFVGEKLNVKVITDVEATGAVLSEARAKEVKEAQEANKGVLRVPRRPKWDPDTTREELLLAERTAFVDWRRRLADVQEDDKLLITPFEKNIEVWRQLWRVIERSDVVVQIVDARNPLLFRCEDLVEYVKEVNPRKRNLLLINKADMLTYDQRLAWATYLRANQIEYAFWSANPQALEELLEEDEHEEHAVPPPTTTAGKNTGNQKQKTVSESSEITEGELETGETEEGEEEGEIDEEGWEDLDSDQEREEESKEVAEETKKMAAESLGALREQLGDEDGTRILDVHALLQLFRELVPQETALDKNGNRRRPTVGLVGYPNVGKSSTINALCGAKMVSVSATPGKTKHFQTIILEEQLCLCDCPGLVFPTFMQTKAEMVCNGILPIDQLRDPVPPASLVAMRIPRNVLEETYGMHIIKPSEEEDPNRPPTGHELLHAFGRARGFMTAHGLPDVQRGGRIVLKDYVKGKLLYCHPPPGLTDEIYNPHLYVPANQSDPSVTNANTVDLYTTKGQTKGHKAQHGRDIDDAFFHQKEVKVISKGVHGGEFSRVKAPFGQTTEQPQELDELGRPLGKPWKKHNNKGKKEKVRRIMEN